MYNNWGSGPPARGPMMGHRPPGPPPRMGIGGMHPQFHPNAPRPVLGVMQRGPGPGPVPGGPMLQGGSPQRMMGPRMMPGPGGGPGHGPGHGPGMPQPAPGGDGRPGFWGGRPPFQHGRPPGPRPDRPPGPLPLVMGGNQGPHPLQHPQQGDQPQQDEALKFRSLQDKAKEWQAMAPDRQMAEVEQQRQAMEEQWKNYHSQMQAYQQQYQQWYQAQEAALANVKLEDLLEKKKNCEKQLTDWKTQFDQWVEQHKQHPNKQQFDQYQNQWKSWQTQMESMLNSLDMQIRIKEYSLQKGKSDIVPTSQAMAQAQLGSMQQATGTSSGAPSVTPDVRTTTAPGGNMAQTPQGPAPSGPRMGPGMNMRPVGPGMAPRMDSGPRPRGPTGMVVDQGMKGQDFVPGSRGPDGRREDMTEMDHKRNELDKKFPFPFPGDFPFPDDVDSLPFPPDMKIDEMFSAGMNPDDFPFPFPDFPMPPDFMKSDDFPFSGEMKPDMFPDMSPKEFPDMSPKEMFAFMSKMESNLEKSVREEMAQTFGETKPSPSDVESRQAGIPPVHPKGHTDSSQRMRTEKGAGFSGANDGSHGIDRSEPGPGRRPPDSDRVPMGMNRGPENVNVGPSGVDGSLPGTNRGPPIVDERPSGMDRPLPGMNPVPPAMDGGYPGMGRGLPSNNMAPPGMNRGPPGIDRGPPGIDRGPPSNNMAPPGMNRGPPGIDRGPPGIDRGPPSNNRAPPGMNRAPPGIDRGPPGIDGGAPSNNRVPPGINRAPPSMDRGPPGIDRGPLSSNRAPPGINRGPPGIDRGPPGIDRGLSDMDRGLHGMDASPVDVKRGPPVMKMKLDESSRGALTGPPGVDAFTLDVEGVKLKAAIAPPGMDDGPPGEEAPYKPPYFSPPRDHIPPGIDIAPPGIDDQHLGATSGRGPAQDEPLPPGMEPPQYDVRSATKPDIAPPGLDQPSPPGEEQNVPVKSDSDISKADNRPDDAELSEFERKQNLPLFPPRQTKGLTQHCIPVTAMIQDSFGSSSFVSSRQTLISNPLAGFDTLESEKARKKQVEQATEHEKAKANTAKSKSVTSSASAAKGIKETEKKGLTQIKTEPKLEPATKSSTDSNKKINIIVKSLKPSDEEPPESSAIRRTLPPPPSSSSKSPAPASIGELFKRNSSGSVGFNKDTKATLRSYRKAAEEDEEDEEQRYEQKKEKDLKDSKVKKDSKGRDDSLRPSAPSPPRGYRSTDRKKKNSPSPDRRRHGSTSKSPDRRRHKSTSKSPDRRRHRSTSKSPDRRKKNSRSPSRKRRDSRSPGRKGSRSPSKRRYSRSPPGRSKHSSSPSRGRSNRSPDRRRSGSNQKDRSERYRDKYSREPRGRDRRSAESSQPNSEAFEKLRELLYDTLVRQPDEKQPEAPLGERRYVDERQRGERSRSPYVTRRENYYPQAERPRMRLPPPPPPQVRPNAPSSDVSRGQPYSLPRDLPRDSTAERTLEKPTEKEPLPDKDRLPPLVFEYEHKESSRPAFDVDVREPNASSLSSAVVVDVVDYNHGQIQQPKIRVLDGKELMEENQRIMLSLMAAVAESIPPVTDESDNVSQLHQDQAPADPVPPPTSQMPPAEQYSQPSQPPAVSQYKGPQELPQNQDEYFHDDLQQDHYQRQPPPPPPPKPMHMHQGQQHGHQPPFAGGQQQPSQFHQQFPQQPFQSVDQHKQEGSYMQHMMAHLQQAPPPPPPKEKAPDSYQPKPPPLPPPSSETTAFPSWSAAPPPPPLESYQPSPGRRSLSPGRDQAGERGKRGRDDMFRDSPHKDFYSDMPQQSQPPPAKVKKREVVAVTDILDPPNREKRPPKICVILRGPPGSGKTYIAKLIKEREIGNGGPSPRMLCLDDYFMSEKERMERDLESGKMVKKRYQEYEYEEGMEAIYHVSLLKTFKKTIEDGFFDFIIVDAVNDKTSKIEPFWTYAKMKGFEVYIAELLVELGVCVQRDIHGRGEMEIRRIIEHWEFAPRKYTKLDVVALLQDAAIPEVEMEDEIGPSMEELLNQEKEALEELEEDEELRFTKSKWDNATEEKLDALDGIKKYKKKEHYQSMEDYMSGGDMFDVVTRPALPGQKRVRWADIEERRDQERKRALGFVIGQTATDWAKITDDNYADKALNRTKYI